MSIVNIRSNSGAVYCIDVLQCDPALLHEPTHVMLNHLYALSIKVQFQVCSSPY